MLKRASFAVGGLLLATLASPGMAGEEATGTVQLFDCGAGRQVIVIAPKGSEGSIPDDPCALPQYQERERPSPFICVGGTCFPRTFVVSPAPRKPGTPSMPH